MKEQKAHKVSANCGWIFMKEELKEKKKGAARNQRGVPADNTLITL